MYTLIDIGQQKAINLSQDYKIFIEILIIHQLGPDFLQNYVIDGSYTFNWFHKSTNV